MKPGLKKMKKKTDMENWNTGFPRKKEIDMFCNLH